MRSKLKTMKRALKLSLKMKSGLSKIVLLIGIPAAFVPALLSVQLQRLTDALMKLNGAPDGMIHCIQLLAALAVLFLLQICFQSLKSYTEDEDAVLGTLYILKNTIKCKCEVKYSYIENEDRFQERLERVNQFSRDQIVRSMTAAAALLSTFLTFVSALTLLWKANPFIVILILATSLPSAWITYRQHSDQFFMNLKWSETSAMVMYYYGVCVEEEFSQDIRHYRLYPYLRKKWETMAEEHRIAKKSLLGKHFRVNAFADALRSIVYLGVIAMTAWQIFRNPTLGLGLFSLVFSLTGQLQNAAFTMLNGAAEFVNSLSYMEEYFYVQDLEKEEQGEDQTILGSGTIQFDHVSYTYPEMDHEVLHDISVSIRDGEKVAIVGENGSGKSTFISLLCGMLKPDSGTITVGGADVGKETGKIRNSLSVVFQNFAHYEDTIRNNIRVSDSNKEENDEEIYQKLSSLHLDDFIRNQKEGLNTKLGSFDDQGNNLSGGQWQKLAIARAAYRDHTRIMVLDEPTSALDPIAEAGIYEDFYKLTGDRTTLLISHRLGITSIVDRILVFRDGRIAEDGSHEELMRKKGIYYKMYEAQAQWYAKQLC